LSVIQDEKPAVKTSKIGSPQKLKKIQQKRQKKVIVAVKLNHQLFDGGVSRNSFKVLGKNPINPRAKFNHQFTALPTLNYLIEWN
jgi:hypothetical protein